MRLTVHEFATLDGIVQVPAGPDQGRKGGFSYCGWQVPQADDDFQPIVSAWFERTGAVLCGRRTFDLMATSLPQAADPSDQVTAVLNRVPKYVVSTTLTNPTWGPTAVISNGVLQAIARLKERADDAELQVHGSRQLVQALHQAGLVDEYRILTIPVVLGTGKRLFETDTPAADLTITRTEVTTSGAVYRELRPTDHPSPIP